MSKGKKIDSESIKYTIIHECGHILALWYSTNIIFDECYVRVYTKRTKGSIGEADYDCSFDALTKTKECLIDLIAYNFAGHLTEIHYGIPHDNGSSDDLEAATATAREMVLEFGMSEAVGLQYFNQKMPPPIHMEAQIQAAIQNFLQQGQERAKKIIKEKKPELDKLILATYNKRPRLNKKELKFKEIEAIIGPRPPIHKPNISWPTNPTK